MHILMLTPAPPRSRSGNRATALRWARILRQLGHRVTLSGQYAAQPCDVMVALHAWRSAEAVRRFHDQRPQRPLVVALTGTDMYRFIHSHPGPTLRSIEVADRLVALHDLAHQAVPEAARGKLRVIYQSATPLPRRLPPRRRSFDVCVAGHLRAEKDSLRAAFAVRGLPEASRIRVLHYGKAHDEAWARMARAEMGCNRRYRWFGELPHWKVRQAYARCRAMVLSSLMEGGANVVSEAVIAGLPVIASRIPGSVGLLGGDYPGYYPAGDTDGLRRALLRAETDPGFLRSLARHGTARAPLFTPEREAAAWRALLDEL